MRLRCAAYTRYSSDRQSPASIDDQLRLCREHAQKQGWHMLEEHIYIDKELSGAGADRPDWMKLLSVIERSPCPFDVLLVDDMSRLTRNLGEMARFTEQMKFIGIRVIAVSQGIDTESEQSDVLMTVQGLTNSYQLKTISQNVRRGLIGCVENGLHTGGRCYGYDNIPIEDHPNRKPGEAPPARLEINETEAVVVRRIFEMKANGGSLKGIAKALNREHIPPPRKRAKRVHATWCPSAIREMLRRELYIGQVIWNKSRFVKKPETNKRLRRMRPESEWRKQERPELRIIDDALWERVRGDIVAKAKKYNYGNRPGLVHRASTSSNLLTGFMKCGVCGANLIIVTGRGKNGHHRYGCPQNFNRGACTNGLKERADVLEERLFSELQNAVFQPEAVEYAVQEFERQLQSSLAGLDNKIGRMRQRAAAIDLELANIIGLARKCGHSPALIAEINRLEQEKSEITFQLLGTETNSVSAEIGRIRQFVTGQLGDIRQLLAVDVQKAKTELEKHVSEIRMVPQVEGKKGHYIAEGEWNLLGGYGEEAENSATKRIRMVGGRI